MCYVPNILEVLMSTIAKKVEIRDLVPDVDQDDGPEFFCDNLVVDGDPETLKADLVHVDDSDAEVFRGVCSS